MCTAMVLVALEYLTENAKGRVILFSEEAAERAGRNVDRPPHRDSRLAAQAHAVLRTCATTTTIWSRCVAALRVAAEVHTYGQTRYLISPNYTFCPLRSTSAGPTRRCVPRCTCHTHMPWAEGRFRKALDKTPGGTRLVVADTGLDCCARGKAELDCMIQLAQPHPGLLMLVMLFSKAMALDSSPELRPC